MFNEQNTVENYVVSLSPQPPFLSGKGESIASPLLGETERGSYALA
jgi:hypothetical protein